MIDENTRELISEAANTIQDAANTYRRIADRYDDPKDYTNTKDIKALREQAAAREYQAHQLRKAIS